MIIQRSSSWAKLVINKKVNIWNGSNIIRMWQRAGMFADVQNT